MAEYDLNPNYQKTIPFDYTMKLDKSPLTLEDLGKVYEYLKSAGVPEDASIDIYQPRGDARGEAVINTHWVREINW